MVSHSFALLPCADAPAPGWRTRPQRDGQDLLPSAGPTWRGRVQPAAPGRPGDGPDGGRPHVSTGPAKLDAPTRDVAASRAARLGLVDAAER